MRGLSLLLAIVCFAPAPPAHAWESELYEPAWDPDNLGAFYTDKLIQDFSYAGYHRGERALPDMGAPVIDVRTFGADPSGTLDSTSAIQAAIDVAHTSRTGNGVVYLPEGVYLVSAMGNACLRIRDSNVVLRGDGPDRTFLLNTTHLMRNKAIIRVEPDSGTSWSSGSLPSTPITQDLTRPTLQIPVAQPDLVGVGDWVIVRNTIGDEWIQEHQEPNWLGYSLAPIMYCRQVAAVDPAGGTLTLDAPIRYALLTRDQARVTLAPPMIEEIGLEDFSIGNLQHPGTSFGSTDYTVPGTAAYDVHSSEAIDCTRVRNSWIRNIATFQPSSNSSTAHILSNGIRLTQCRGLTLENCVFQRPQYGGGGGNGYMYRVMGNENLLRHCTAEFSRHGLVFSHMYSSGNVLVRCTDRRTKRATGATGSYVTGGAGSDHHMHFTHSNLIDSCLAEDSFFAAHYRPYGSIPQHNLTAAHSVFWNTASRGSAYPYCVHTQQSRYGYAIGTSGTGDDVRTNAVGNSSAKTDPPDHVEGVGLGETLEPQSLYDHQAPAFLPPGAPAGVVAEAGDGRVFLDWSDNPEPDVASYRLYRGTAMQGPYTQLAVGVAESDYVDATVVNGTTYFYSITAVDQSEEEGTRSIRVSAVPEPGITLPPVIHSYSSTQQGNEPPNLLDGDPTDSSRWSAQGFPQWVVIDYRFERPLQGILLWTYQERAYRYTVEASSAPESGFTTIVDRSENTGTAQPLRDYFPTVSGRYLRITVSGADGYTGGWVSLNEIEVVESARLSIVPSPTGNIVVRADNLSAATDYALQGIGRLPSSTWTDLDTVQGVEDAEWPDPPGEYDRFRLRTIPPSSPPSP